MRTFILLTAIIAASAAPALAQTPPANTASQTKVTTPQLADGTYTGSVEKVLDSKHIVVKLSNGREATLTTARANVDFSKCQANQQIRFSTIGGLVAVYGPADQP